MSNILTFPLEERAKQIEKDTMIMTKTLDDEQVEIEQHVVKETRDSFSKKVEELVWDKDIPYLDAVMELMEKGGHEPESMGKLISKELYSKLEKEAEDLSLLKQTKNRLEV